MSRLRFSILLATVALIFCAPVVYAQDDRPYEPQRTDVSDAPAPPTYETPPAITVVDGTVRLVRQSQSRAADISMPLLQGDRIVTEAGRAGVTFADGSVLHIDRNSTVDFLSGRLVRVLDGRVILRVAGRGGERPATDYQIDAAAGSAQVQAVGEYHVDTYSEGGVAEVELSVVSGVATLMNERGNVEVDAGQSSVARADASPGYPRSFNSARWDAFEVWSEDQRNESVGDNSNQYLPSDLQPYSGEFDRYGRWDNVPDYGYVWYPRVAVGWRPYYRGYWDYCGPYGWTWIGYDPWAWPTHHFGRWGFRAGLWFWVPGRHWGPAFVRFAFGPSYVSWCPLDFYNRPVLNIFGRFGRGWHRDAWNVWTTVPRHSFGPGHRVGDFALTGSRAAVLRQSDFAVTRGVPPAPRAVARGSAVPGVAVPRALSPTASTSPRAEARGSFPTPSSRASRQGYDRALPAARAGGRADYGNTRPMERGSNRPSSAAPRERAMPYANSRPYSSPSARGSETPNVGRRALPQERVAPRGNDRPPNASPRGYNRPSAGAPAPEYHRGPSIRYSDPSSSPRYSPPPSAGAPRGYERSGGYSAPSAPRGGGESYRAAPRGGGEYRAAPPSGGPRGGGPAASAPRSSGGSRSAPSGGSSRGGGSRGNAQPRGGSGRGRG